MTPRVADYIRNLIETSGKTRKEIAAQTGFEKPNIISMLKSGGDKVASGKSRYFCESCKHRSSTTATALPKGVLPGGLGGDQRFLRRLAHDR